MSCHSVLAARFGEKMVSGRRGEVPAFWWLALTRRWFPGDVLVGAKSQRFDMVAHFGAKLLFGSPVLMGETSECFGGSLIREDVPGVVCWWDRSQGSLVARFCENLIFGSRP